MDVTKSTLLYIRSLVEPRLGEDPIDFPVYIHESCQTSQKLMVLIQNNIPGRVDRIDFELCDQDIDTFIGFLEKMLVAKIVFGISFENGIVNYFDLSQ